MSNSCQISYDMNGWKRYPCEVIITDRERDDVLTQAFKHPELLNDSARFFHQYRMFEADNTQVNGSRCLVMSYCLDRTGLAVALFIGVIFCIAIGVVGGLLSRRMDVGFLLGGGCLTLLTAAQGTIFWISG